MYITLACKTYTNMGHAYMALHISIIRASYITYKTLATVELYGDVKGTYFHWPQLYNETWALDRF